MVSLYICRNSKTNKPIPNIREIKKQKLVFAAKYFPHKNPQFQISNPEKFSNFILQNKKKNKNSTISENFFNNFFILFFSFIKRPCVKVNAQYLISIFVFQKIF